MDLKIYKVSSHYLLVLYTFIAHISHSAGDEFNTRVQITPETAQKGQTVEFQCDFTLTDGNDLHLLYWETTNGERMFTYNHPENEPKEHEPYKSKNKIQSYKYITSVDGGGPNDRRHILKMLVDNCDRATYRCLVLNQNAFEEGSAQKALEIKANLPPPKACFKIDGDTICQTEPVYRQNKTTVSGVSCDIEESSVKPELTLTKNGEEISVTPVTQELDGCLHNGNLNYDGDIVIEQGEETTFKCKVNYGGTEETCAISITFINPCDSSPCKNGGTCVPTGPEEYNCTCPMNYNGNTCENTACLDNDCHENATCVPANDINYECSCLGNTYGTLCVEKSSGSEDCDGFSCEEWKIVVICIAVLVVIVLIVAVIILIAKKSNALCAVSHSDELDNGKKPLEKSNGDIESQTPPGGAVVRGGTPFDMEVNSLNASRGNDGKPRGTFYENAAMENERLSHESIGDRSSASRLPDVEAKPPPSPHALPAISGAGGVMASAVNGRAGRLAPIDANAHGEDGEKKKKKKKRKKKKKERDSMEESQISYDNTQNAEDYDVHM